MNIGRYIFFRFVVRILMLDFGFSKYLFCVYDDINWFFLNVIFVLLNNFCIVIVMFIFFYIVLML